MIIKSHQWLALYDSDGDISNVDGVWTARTLALCMGFKYLVQVRPFGENDFHVELAFRTQKAAEQHIKSIAKSAYVWATISRMHGANIYFDGTTGDYHYQYSTYVADFYSNSAN